MITDPITDQPYLKPIKSKGLRPKHVLESSFYCKVWIRGVVYNLMIPKGFVTDAASTPRLLWFFYPPRGLYDAASLIHDYIYARKGDPMWDSTYSVKTPHITQKEADGIFKNVMKRSGCSRLTVFIMHAGVRLGGWKSWIFD